MAVVLHFCTILTEDPFVLMPPCTGALKQIFTSLAVKDLHLYTPVRSESKRKKDNDHWQVNLSKFHSLMHVKGEKSDNLSIHKPEC